jgi:photosystem II stability/assembly factor-like uncharacterized protein
VTEDPSLTQDFIYNLAATSGFGHGVISSGYAARNTGLYRSDDGGLTWKEATLSLQLSAPVAATAVAIPSDYDQDHIILAGMVGGILRSIDGGRSWHLPTLASPPPVISALALSPNFSRDGVALAGTLEDGVLSSFDHGSTWVSWNFGLLDLNVLCLAISPAFMSDETVFAGTETGIFRSTNGGRAWREVNLPIGFEPVLSLVISPAFEQDGTIFAGTESQGVLISRDGGDTWTTLTAQFNGEPINGINISPTFPAQPEIVILSNGLAWMSHDLGATWAQLWPDIAEEGREISALYAPQGFGPGCKAWLGMYGGEILQAEF